VFVVHNHAQDIGKVKGTIHQNDICIPVEIKNGLVITDTLSQEVEWGPNR
jgi:hypothetical protein